MRKQLSGQEGLRRKFRAIFSRLGKKSGYNGYSEETVLLKEIMDVETNTVIADHVWFNFSMGFQKARLEEGMSIEFEARVKKYSKGYVNRKTGIGRQSVDYKLSHPTKIKVVVVNR